ncbi:MAG: nucleotide sugar dehydrogenase [Candidatus Margulisiibacteriota bacterium]
MNFRYDVCVVGGCGHVGLPLAMTLANAGQKTIILDKNQAALEQVAAGKMPFKEEGADPLLKKVLRSGKLNFTDQTKCVAESKHIVIIIGTPIDEFMNPKMQDIYKIFEDLLPRFKTGQTIILRSTIYPGTTKMIGRLLKNNKKKVKLAFCPERVAEGKAIEEIKELPQIISGIDKASEASAAKLFKLIAKEILILSPEEAELAKLFTNSWRYIQFAVANQFYMIADAAGVDFYKVFKAIKHNYPRTQGFPGPGFSAGPCLLKDTMQIAAFNNNQFYLGHSAMLINEGLPNYIVTKLKEKVELHNKSVAILGMAFKANNDDRRDSLAYKLKKLLEIEAKKVYCTDVYIKDETFYDLKTALQKSDIIILGAPHREYKKLKFRKGQIIIDIWNFWG